MSAGFGLYIHWPFCAAKCPYCDFNSHVSARVDVARWEKALRSELRRVARETPDHILGTIFFGGGTPSLMPPELVGTLIEDARRLWRCENDLEITLEANPTSIERARFEAFRNAGVGRVSLGVQALNDGDLKRLGRMHNARDALDGLEIACATFDRVSIDLIYARQGQTAEAWETELRQAISLGLDHLSLYQLTIEPGTVFEKRHRRGRLPGLPDEDRAFDLWQITQDTTRQAGLFAYEVSNHAKPGAESKHNLLYWRGGQWAGIGPGAHGRLEIKGTRFATETALAPNTWLHSVEQFGSGETDRSSLSADEEIDERLLMGLRLSEGMDLRRLAGLGWKPPEAAVSDLLELDYVALSQDRLRVTDAGRPVLNAIIERLLV